MLSLSPYTVKDLPAFGVSLVVDARDPAVSKPILALGEYEPHVTRHLLSRVGEDTRFLDVGANIGFFTVVVAQKARRGKVWSLEPDPGNFRLLRTNVALNGLEGRVDARNLAADDRQGSLFFSTLGYDANLGARFTARDKATLVERSLPGAGEPVIVDAVRLDEWLRGEKVDLVKVDVEGFEPAVFRGMEGILRGCRPSVITEFAPGTIRHISRSDPADFLRFFEGVGYEIGVLDRDGAVTKMRTADILARPGAGGHHLDLVLEPAGR
jgi:FkbM family methyltransferase